MMFLQIAAIALVSTSPAVSTSSSSSVVLPSAPIAVSQIHVAKKSNFNKLDFALYAGTIAYRAGDFYTTERALANGGHEVELPQSFVSSKAGFAAYSFGMAALQIEGSILLHKHGHAKLARWADAISIGAGVATDISNIGAAHK